MPGVTWWKLTNSIMVRRAERKPTFARPAASVSLGSKPTFAARCTNDRCQLRVGFHTLPQTTPEMPGELAGFSVLLNRVPVRVSETERAVAEELFQSLPALETYLGSRAAYVRMDREGLLGVIADKTPNRALAAHVQSAVKEAGDLLEEIDQLILNPAEVA